MSNLSGLAPPASSASRRCPHIYLLGGQGSTSVSSLHFIASALQDAQQQSNQLLLTVCQAAFLEELASLSPQERERCSLDRVPFSQNVDDILLVPSYLRAHPVFANVTLYVAQLLRLCSHIRVSDLACQSSGPQPPVFLGFSTGILAASVFAASSDSESLLKHAIAGLRSAFWLGYHTHLFAIEGSPSRSLESPWSVVLVGCSKDDAATAISAFNDAHTNTAVHLTAVTHARCLTVSGPPDAIADFEASYVPPSTTTSQLAHIYALYHAPVLRTTKERALSDIRRRGVRFPGYNDLKCSLRSTIDGSTIDPLHHRPGSTLVEDVLDMILVHPVRFDEVTRWLSADLLADDVDSVCLVNIGPGTGPWRSAIHALQDDGLVVEGVDWSSSRATAGTTAERPPSPRELSIQPISDMPRTVSVPRWPVNTEQQTLKEPIAIVGMSVNFPGAPDVAGFWEVLRDGLNTLSEVPSSRFDVADYMDGADNSGRVLQSVHGNFLEDAEVFDNAFFRVSPREARSMDPQQRVLLHVAYHALEDAGFVPNATPSYDPDNIAVYVGAATNDYVHNLRDQMDVYYSTGTLQAFLSGKVSYAFGFGGPSVVVDTACSSAVVAIHQACRSLQAGDCSAALAGGVNVITSPDMHIGLDRAHFLSPTGQCRPWDASADGYCRAEGCGMFVLKRLSDALAEKDRVLAVIRAVEVNQSGTADSITHPHVATQARLFRRVLDAAGVRPAEVSVVEAHGTGTRAGDPAEVEALRAVFGGDLAGRAEGERVHLTSVKANIGHAEAASGAASLAKLVLMMRHGTIPRTISLKKLNPRIAPLEQDGLCIDTEARAWRPATMAGRRVAMLNNFGAAGSNAALVLEEPPPVLPTSDAKAEQHIVLGLSCDSLEAVEELRERYIARLTDHPPDCASLVDLAYTATARRQLYRCRIAVGGMSSEEVCRGLRAAPVVHVGERRRKVVFLFSGQGSQYRGMGSGVYEKVPSFREAVNLCHDKLVSWGYDGVKGIIGASPQTEGSEDSLVVSHCALFVLEYALAKMWRSWGVHPDIVVGHSLGEYAALVCAGAVDLDDALRLIAERARLMERHCVRGSSGMLAIRASSNDVEKLLRAHEGLSMACYNSDGDSVVGGALTQLEDLQGACKASGFPCRRLDVPFAYHTQAMRPIIEEMQALSAKIRFSAPTIPLVSTTLGAVIPVGEAGLFVPDYFAKHCRDPVLFHQGIRALLDHDTEVREAMWLEVGPNAVTSPLLRSNGVGASAMTASTLRKGQLDGASLGSTLAQLYCSGAAVNWRSVFAELAPDARVTDSPMYPFAKTRFWVPYTETRQQARSGPSRKPSSTFSGSTTVSERIQWPSADSGQPVSFELDIAELAQFIDSHQVVGTPLCPASVYNELVLSASRAWCDRIGLPPFASSLILDDITFEAPLVHTSEHPSTVSVEVTAKGNEGGFTAQFAIRSGVSAKKGMWKTHCTGNVRADLVDSVAGYLSCFRDKIQECIATLQIGALNTRTLYSSTIYDGTFSNVVKYSDAFRTIKVITIRCDGADAYALAQLPAPESRENIVQPIFMDTLLHAAGLMLNLESDGCGHIFVCCHIQTVTILPDHLRASAMFGVYVQIGYLSQSMAIADAYAIDLEGNSGQVFAHLGKIRFRRLSVPGFRAILSLSVHESGVASSSSSGSVTGTDNDLSSHESIPGIIAQMCDIPTSQISPDARLEHLGVDSLMSIELTGRLNALFPSLNLSPRTLSSLDRVKDLVGLVEKSTPTPTQVELDCSRSSRPMLGDNVAGSNSLTIEHVKDMLSTVLDIPAEKLADDDRLDRLGLDSLSSIELRHTFSSSLRIHFPQDVLARCSTVKDLSVAIAGLSGRPCQAPCLTGNVSATPNPILLQEGGDRGTPLFLVHDGSGMVHPYMSLDDLGRTVWGIHNPKLPSGDEWAGGILELAAHYAGLVRNTLDAGQPCMVGGWSFGGVVAFELARMLIASGTQVLGLVLIDSPHPQMGVQLSDAVISAVVSAKVPNPRHAELVRLQMRYASKALLEYDPCRSPASRVESPQAVMLRSRDGYDVHVADNETARFLTDRRDPARSVVGWQKLLGRPVPVLDIPGNHFQPFEPENVAIVTERLREALEMLGSGLATDTLTSDARDC